MLVIAKKLHNYRISPPPKKKILPASGTKLSLIIVSILENVNIHYFLDRAILFSVLGDNVGYDKLGVNIQGTRKVLK